MRWTEVIHCGKKKKKSASEALQKRHETEKTLPARYPADKFENINTE